MEEKNFTSEEYFRKRIKESKEKFILIIELALLFD